MRIERVTAAVELISDMNPVDVQSGFSEAIERLTDRCSQIDWSSLEVEKVDDDVWPNNITSYRAAPNLVLSVLGVLHPVPAIKLPGVEF